jgi:hypothetical protein
MVDQAAAPAGFAPVFAGWNVWDVWQADDPDQGVLGAIWYAGVSEDQLLKLWVESYVEKNAPGANVSDPLNPDPTHYKGDEIQIIPKPTGLAIASARESAGLGGTLQEGNKGSTARLVSVRFYNRGSASVVPWPHDQNFLVDAVYTPSTTNPITDSAAPTTVGAAVAAAGQGLGEVVKVVAIVGGAIVAAILVSKIIGRRAA